MAKYRSHSPINQRIFLVQEKASNLVKSPCRCANGNLLTISKNYLVGGRTIKDLAVWEYS